MNPLKNKALLIGYSFDEQCSRNMREFLTENTQKRYHISNTADKGYNSIYVELHYFLFSRINTGLHCQRIR